MCAHRIGRGQLVTILSVALSMALRVQVKQTFQNSNVILVECRVEIKFLECAGHGQCANGTCVCEEGWQGVNCFSR